jgi:hypothetical protein
MRYDRIHKSSAGLHHARAKQLAWRPQNGANGVRIATMPTWLPHSKLSMARYPKILQRGGLWLQHVTKITGTYKPHTPASRYRKPTNYSWLRKIHPRYYTYHNLPFEQCCVHSNWDANIRI